MKSKPCRYGCGATVWWPDVFDRNNPKPPRSKDDPNSPIHRCDEFRKQQEAADEKIVDRELNKTQAHSVQGTVMSTTDVTPTHDDRIKELSDRKYEQNKHFLVERKRYNDIYEKDVQLRKTFVKLYLQDLQARLPSVGLDYEDKIVLGLSGMEAGEREY